MLKTDFPIQTILLNLSAVMETDWNYAHEICINSISTHLEIKIKKMRSARVYNQRTPCVCGKQIYQYCQTLFRFLPLKRKIVLFAWKLWINSALLLTISWIYTIFTISIQSENFGWDFFFCLFVYTQFWLKKNI